MKPTVSCGGLTGMMSRLEMAPWVGRRPRRPLSEAGRRTEQPVSVPSVYLINFDCDDPHAPRRANASSAKANRVRRRLSSDLDDVRGKLFD